jgi:hypothetical protein
MGRNLFLDITLKPAVDLDRMEEVLVITSQKQREPDVAGLGPIRASDILAQHLPGVPQVVPGTQPGTPGGPAQAAGSPPAVVTPNGTQPNATHSTTPNAAPNGTPKPPRNAPQSKPQGTQTNATHTAAQGAAPSTKSGATPGVPHAAAQSKPSAPQKPQATKPATAEGTRSQ